eukprot:7366632-Pyramimonas_sp.AAC.1
MPTSGSVNGTAAEGAVGGAGGAALALAAGWLALGKRASRAAVARASWVCPHRSALFTLLASTLSFLSAVRKVRG